jgi:hypothetical protein
MPGKRKEVRERVVGKSAAKDVGQEKRQDGAEKIPRIKG